MRSVSDNLIKKILQNFKVKVIVIMFNATFNKILVVSWLTL
jgi:hypothetical protein